MINTGSILDILNTIGLDNSRKFKERVLSDNYNNALLKKVFWAAYNPDLVFWISKHPEVEIYAGTLSLDTAIDEICANLCQRKVTGNSAVKFYHDVLASLTEDNAVVLRRIIDRDLRCGVAVPTINKIWSGLVPTYELMLAASDPKRLVFPDVVVQTKYDGIRCLVAHLYSGDIQMRTRNGNLITSLEVMYPDFRKTIPVGEIWDGELVCYSPKGIPLPRKVSNGIANKAIRNTISEKEADSVRFACWDVVDETQTIPYSKRLLRINDAILVASQCGMTKVLPVCSTVVSSLADVEKLFNEALERGEEGVIAKNLNSVWEPKRSFNLCKFKAELTADLEVVEWIEGSGKYSGMMGSLVCSTSDEQIQVNVGSGFSDAQRKTIKASDVIGKIVEVKYNARISKKSEGKDSLYLPRFIKFRDKEKTTANSSEELK